MADDSLFAGIDIGTTAIRIAVGQRIVSGDKEEIHIIGAAEAPSEGIGRESITSIEDAVSSVSACLEKVERMVGMQVSSAWVAISGSNVRMAESRGVIAVSRPDGIIREEDVDRVVEASHASSVPVNHDVIHIIPKRFIIDGQPGVKDPVNMNGIRLEVETQIIQGMTSHMKNLETCIYRTGAKLDKFVLATIAAAEVTITKRQKELGVALVNIGRSSTNVIVYEQGEIMHMASIPIGSEHITADIAIGLRTHIDIAEQVKTQHATTNPKDFTKDDCIDLKDLGGTDSEIVGMRFVAEIVRARSEELLEMVDKELIKIKRSGMLPAGIVITGGGAKLPGLVELTKQKLRLPASLGYASGISSISDRVNDLAFTTAMGLVRWGINETPSDPRRKGGAITEKVIEGFRGIFARIRT